MIEHDAMRRRARSLSRVSALALIAVAGGARSASADSCLHVSTPTTITGSTVCVRIDTSAIIGNVINNATVTNTGSGQIAFFVGRNVTGDLSNTGQISGGLYGVVIDNSAFTGNFSNSGSISATTGDAFEVESAVAWLGNIANTGVISAVGENGLVFEGKAFGSSLSGNNAISNSGTITAEGEALFIGWDDDDAAQPANTKFYGSILNTGTLSGGEAGAEIVVKEFHGAIVGGQTIAFSNSGLIEGTGASGVGVSINVSDVWAGDIVNQAGGAISGNVDGLQFFAGKGATFTGDVKNYGIISGGGTDSALHLSAPSHTGLVQNFAGGTLSAASNALHLEFDTQAGDVSNDGLIEALSSTGTAVRLEGYSGNGHYTGADGFTNTGTIRGGASGTGVVVLAAIDNGITNTGTITAQTALDTRNAAAGMTLANTGGGVIEGDVLLNANFGDTYIAGSGRFIGTIQGAAGSGGLDDDIRVQSGTQSFIGSANDIRDLTVASGVGVFGAAAIGANGIGDTGFNTTNVGSMHVTGGTAYLDDNSNLHVGTYSQGAGGTLDLFVTTNTSVHGQIHATNGVSLDGALLVHLDPASFAGASGTQYTFDNVVLSDQAGGVSGHFATVGFEGASYFFQIAADYSDGNSVDLHVTRTPFNDNPCLNTQNQQNIGSVLEAIFEAGGTINPNLMAYLVQIASQSNCAAIDGLYNGLGTNHGDINALVVHSPWQGIVEDRLSASGSPGCVVSGDNWCFGRYAENSATAVQTDARREDPFQWLKTGVRDSGSTSIWGRYIGVWGDTNGDVSSPGTKFGVNGAIVGIDHVVSPTFLIGAAGQWTTTNVDFVGSPSNGKVDSIELGGYASYGDTNFYINGNVSYIWHDFSTSRSIPGPFTAKAGYNGGTIAAYAEMGKIFEAGGFRLQPVGAVSFSALHSDGYTETGAPGLNLIVDGSNYDSLRSLAGARVAYPVQMDSGRKIVPELRASWLHEFLEDASTITAAVESAPALRFDVTGEKISRDTLDLGAGVTVPITGVVTGYVDYDAALNRDQTAQTVSAGLRATW